MTLPSESICSVRSLSQDIVIPELQEVERVTPRVSSSKVGRHQTGMFNPLWGSDNFVGHNSTYEVYLKQGIDKSERIKVEVIVNAESSEARTSVPFFRYRSH